MQDLRFAIRSFRRQPVFTIVALLTLGIGIGGNTAIFSLFYQVLLRPLPYPDAGRLVFVWNTYPRMGLPQAAVSIPDFLDRVTQAPSIEDATLMTMRSLNLAAEGRPEQLRVLAVTPSFFTTLRREPERGRAFSEADAEPGADRFAILTASLWRSRFGGDSSVIGREIRLSGEPYQVVGVLPSDFELPARDIAILVPYSFTPVQRSDASRGNESSQMIARLKPGASIAGLQAEMATIVARNLDRLPERRTFAEASGFGGYAVPIRDQLVGDVRQPLYLLQAGVLLVLLIACANVANLLLMRVSDRQRELAIRSTLGAGSGRLTRQLLIESVVLAAGGAIVGLALGMAGARALLALTASELPGAVDSSLHPAVVLFTVVLALGTGVMFGIVPALAVMRGDLAAFLKEDGAKCGTAGRRSTRAHAALVIAETAVALALLVGAGLLIKSFAGLRATDPGFSSERVLTATLALPEVRYRTTADRSAFWGRLIDEVGRIPGVTATGLTSNIPLSGNVSSGSYSILGYTPGPGEAAPHGRQEAVGGDYFRTMQIPLVAGRTFDERDGPESPPVVVIDQYLVKRYFATGDPIGRQIRRGGPASPVITIIGVVGTINAIDLGQPVSKERLYYPITQVQRPMMSLMLKTAIEPETVVAQVRAAVQRLDPEQPLANVRTMEQWMAQSLETRRAPMMLFAAFGLVALVLAAIGTYGVLAFGVAQRGRELGIRQALGADQRAILSLVLSQGLRRAGAGIVLGGAAALALGRLLQSQLVGVTPRDTGVLAGATILLLAVSVAACYLPARRAMRLDPADALRDG
jgi:putative ABC transport system permease protein